MGMQQKASFNVERILRKIQGYCLRVDVLNSNELALYDTNTGAIICKTTPLHLQHLAERGLIDRQGSAIKLSDAGAMFMRRAESSDDQFATQHRALRSVEVRDEGRRWQALQNDEESPLKALYRRKTKSGNPFLSQKEFEAGERLRRDFTFGALMPSVTMRWQEKLGGCSGSDKADFSDQTLGARHRVNKALDAVGPELGSLLIDVCCFLKGMETIERERGWPVRSAKVVLKTALLALERHYHPKNHNRPQQYQRLQDLQDAASV